jgi:hypothetical protein
MLLLLIPEDEACGRWVDVDVDVVVVWEVEGNVYKGSEEVGVREG